MKNLRVGVFADREVGEGAIKFLLENYRDDLVCVVVTEKDTSIIKYLRDKNFDSEKIFRWAELSTAEGRERLKKFNLDYIILAWWSYIIKKNIIEIPKRGVLNFHPSYLPHNAGKHPNFWNLIEQRPFGVTIHFVDENIDSGDIVFQKRIETTWEDTGKSLYDKERAAMLQLFAESYPLIRQGNYTRRPQNKSEGSFHYGKEMSEKIKLNLDDVYTVRDLLNLLRAKTFPPYEGCYFFDDNSEWDIKIFIAKKENAMDAIENIVNRTDGGGGGNGK